MGHEVEVVSQVQGSNPQRTTAHITPLEPVVDSFSTPTHDVEMVSHGKVAGETLPEIQTTTPPVTPDLPSVHAVTSDAQMEDPPLFPDTSPRDGSASPLIAPFDSPPAKKTIYPDNLGITTPEAALDMWRSCVEEQRRWRQELELLPRPARSTRTANRDATSESQVSRLNKSGGVTKPTKTSRVVGPKSAAVPTPAAAPKKASPVAKKTAAPRKKSVKLKATSEGPSETSQGQKKYTRAAPSKKLNAAPWEEIEDFTPPISTLDNQHHEIRWEGTTKDLSNDEDLHHLHPLEQRWSSRLRLDAKAYLAAKRKIFKEKVRYLRMAPRKNFSKTAAQNAVTMDVNKASRLHQAFEAVGWFDEGRLRGFLEEGVWR